MIKHQLLPIYLRISIKGKHFGGSTRQHVNTAEWLLSVGKVKGCSASTLQINIEPYLGILYYKANVVTIIILQQSCPFLHCYLDIYRPLY